MEVLLETRTLALQLHEQGFVEVIVAEGQEVEVGDAMDIQTALEAKNIDRPRILINRVNRYSTASSLLLLHSREGQMDSFHVRPLRVAYLVYQPVTEAISDFVGKLVFKNALHEVFADRDAAIAWLLAD